MRLRGFGNPTVCCFSAGLIGRPVVSGRGGRRAAGPAHPCQGGPGGGGEEGAAAGCLGRQARGVIVIALTVLRGGRGEEEQSKAPHAASVCLSVCLTGVCVTRLGNEWELAQASPGVISCEGE